MVLAPDAPSEYTHFKQAVASMLPVRLDDYKQGQMERRIRDLARKHGIGRRSGTIRASDGGPPAPAAPSPAHEQMTLL